LCAAFTTRQYAKLVGEWAERVLCVALQRGSVTDASTAAIVVERSSILPRRNAPGRCYF